MDPISIRHRYKSNEVRTASITGIPTESTAARMSSLKNSKTTRSLPGVDKFLKTVVLSDRTIH